MSTTRLEWHGGPRTLGQRNPFGRGMKDPNTRKYFETLRGVPKLALFTQDVEQPAADKKDEHAPISTWLDPAALCKVGDTRQLFIYRLDGAPSVIFVTDCATDEDAVQRAGAIAGYGYGVELWSNGIRVHAGNGNTPTEHSCCGTPLP
jgi:hypothetical protein